MVKVGIQLCFQVPSCHNSVYHYFPAELSSKCSIVYLSLALFNGLLVYLLVLAPIWNSLNFYEFMSWCLVQQLLPDVSSHGCLGYSCPLSFHINFRICLLSSRMGVKGWVWGLVFGFGLHWIYRSIWIDVTTFIKSTSACVWYVSTYLGSSNIPQ